MDAASKFLTLMFLHVLRALSRGWQHRMCHSIFKRVKGRSQSVKELINTASADHPSAQTLLCLADHEPKPAGTIACVRT